MEKILEGSQSLTPAEAAQWSPKREWWKRGADFLVTVKHHVAPYSDEGERNCWNVYAFIYPKHPHFANFNGEDMCQSACNDLPLHWGPSFHRVHFDAAGKVTAHQVGCDYAHIHDDRFQRSEPMDQFPNGQVFRDADDLFDWLTSRAEVKGEAHQSQIEF